MSSATDARVRRPVLLDRLPGGFLSSSGFVAAAAGGTIFYGLALAVVWSGIVKDRDQSRLAAAQVHPQPISTTTTPTIVPTSPTNATTAAPPPPKPAPIATTPAPPPATTQVASVSQPSAATPTVAPPKVAEPPKPPPQPERDATALGALIDPTGKAQLDRSGAALTLKVPGKLCFLNPVAKIDTAPRALTGVEGNFELTVRVNGDEKGEMKPGADALKNAPLGPNGVPFSFNGAGLLIWRDLDNFLRLERAAGTQNGRNVFPVVVLEVWKDGKLVAEASPDLPPGPLSLKVERRGTAWTCSHSADGQTWSVLTTGPKKDAKEVTADYGNRVEVGVLGSNTSKKSFLTHFEGFRLSPR